MAAIYTRARYLFWVLDRIDGDRSSSRWGQLDAKQHHERWTGALKADHCDIYVALLECGTDEIRVAQLREHLLKREEDIR